MPTELAPLAGTLNRRVSILQGKPSSDSEGNAILAWTPVGDVWANVSPMTTQEMLLAAQRAEEVTHTVVIRYQPAFLAAQMLRVMFGTRAFLVVGITDPDEAHLSLQLRCREVVTAAETGAV